MNDSDKLVYKSRFPFVSLLLPSAMAILGVAFGFQGEILTGSFLFIVSYCGWTFRYIVIEVYENRVVVDKPLLPFSKITTFFNDEISNAGFVMGWRNLVFAIDTQGKMYEFSQSFEANERDRIIDALEYTGLRTQRL